jgi:hypothetical protein
MKVCKKCKKEIKSLLCAAVDIASCQHGLETHTVYGRHGGVLKYDKTVLTLSALNWLLNIFKMYVTL